MGIGGGVDCSWYLLDKKACCMIIIFVVPAGFVHPSFPFPASPVRPSVRPSLPSRSSFPFSSSLCAPPLPGTGFSSQTRRGVFDKLASPPLEPRTLHIGPIFMYSTKGCIRSRFCILCTRLLPPCATPPLPCSISIPYLLLRTIIFFCLSLLPLSSKFDLPPPLRPLLLL